MKEPYVEGLANHDGHESCAGSRKAMREALDSGMYRLGIEPRKIIKIRVLTLSALSESYTADIDMRDINGLYVVGDPIHVQKLFARESGEPAINLDMVQVRIENPLGAQQ